jgi:hypothetical protein
MRGHDDVVYACTVTTGGRVVSASVDKTLKVWDLESGRELATLEGHTEEVVACAVTLDGRRLISASNRDTLKVWNLGSGRVLANLGKHDDSLTACALTPDGRRIISASHDASLRVWNLRSGRLLAVLEGHTDAVSSCVVTPCGRHVVSTSWDETLKIWNLKSGRELNTLEGHTWMVDACAVTPCGHRVVSASWDRTLKIWDLATGHCLATIHGLFEFKSIAVGHDLICAGDRAGNLWILEPSPTINHPEATMTTPIRVFFSYAHKDEALRSDLSDHLSILQRQGLIEAWTDREISAGTEWEGQISENLEKADLILLLVSASFMGSKYCYDTEMKRALARHEAKEARVVPIIIREADWTSAPFGKLQALPRLGKAVTSWANQDEAWTDVAKGLRKVVDELSVQRTTP